MGQRLTQIATRTGDDGTTGLGDGTRVPKDHLRVQAMGDVDELNSSLGVLLAEPLPAEVRALLQEIQHELFNLGGHGVGTPIRASDLEIGDLVNAQPEAIFPSEESGLPELHGAELLIAKSKAAVIVVRMEPETIIPGEGRDNWSVDGIVCYSKICTHVGCPISLYERTTHHLLCPCHQSTFDLSDSGRVVFGPAGRHLPQLPLAVDEEGFLVAQSDFTEPVGPTYWERDHKDIGDQGEAEL